MGTERSAGWAPRTPGLGRDISPWFAYALFASVAVMWFVPDRRLSR